MSNKVIPLRADRAPVGQYIRVGMSGHRQAEDLIEEGRFPVDRAIIDAAAVGRQGHLIAALSRKRCELVLDTDIAELSTIGRFEGAASQAPWALKSRPLSLADFQGERRRELLSSVAEMAIGKGFSAVLSPTHLLKDASDPWLPSDVEACLNLRETLNRAGGHHVDVDYELLLPYHMLRDTAQRAQLSKYLQGLPIGNLWIRASQFGADASAAGVRRYIDALYDFAQLQYPIISDGVAGLVGLAVLAFAAAGGVAHGIGDHERFDAAAWNKPRKLGGGGPAKRVLIPGLDRHISQAHLSLLSAASGGRRLLVCNDNECCRRGLFDMINNSKAHYLFQRREQIDALSNVPQAARPEHLIRYEVVSAERRARQIAKLKVADPAIINMLEKETARLERMPLVLEDMLASGLPATRSSAPRFRSTPAASSKQARS